MMPQVKRELWNPLVPDRNGTPVQDRTAQMIIPKRKPRGFGGVSESLPEEGTLSDLWRFCRVCACASEVMVAIYGENGVELQLEEKINQYLPITVSADDHLPLQVCPGCVDKLNTTHDLIVTCLDSHARFANFSLLEESDNESKVGEQRQEQGEPVDDLDELVEDNAKVKKKVVVVKLVHSNNSHLSPSVRIAKALEYLKSKKKDVTEGNIVSIDDVNDDLCDKLAVKKNCIRRKSEMDKMEVASIAEFCVVTSKDSSCDFAHKTPKLQSKISKALGKVDNGTKQRIVEAVQSIVERTDPLQKNVSCRHCGMAFFDRGTLASHTCPRKVYWSRGSEFKCKVCSRSFRDRYKLAVHKSTHTPSARVLSCDRCGETLPRLYSLYIHQLSHVERKPFLCRCCGRRFQHSSSLRLHEATEHAGLSTKVYSCQLCGKGFSCVSSLRQHRKIHAASGTAAGRTLASAHMRTPAPAPVPAQAPAPTTPTAPSPIHRQRLVCSICSTVLPDQQTHSAHIRMHAQEQLVFKCSQCPKAFPTLEKVRQHEPIHQGVRPYQCGICSIGFIRKGNLTKHYKTHSTEKVVTCRICKATFPSVAGLLNHRKSHTSAEWSSTKETGPEEQPLLGAADNYQCPVCNKFLSSKLSLSLHMRVHTGEKPYECGVCNKRFTQKPALTYHMRLHTGERPHACQFCGKGFNSKVGKESHERIHTGERPYKCGQCGVGFRCSANLRQHTWIHTDNRPFTCEVCNKLFRRREALQVHMRIHTGERPYSCPICGRSFTQKGDMLKHTRSHSKRNMRVPAMLCIFCGESFTRKTQYKTHVDKCSRGRGHKVVCTPAVVVATPTGGSMAQAAGAQPGAQPAAQEPVVVQASGDHNPPELITFRENVVLKNEAKDLNTVTIASEDVMTSFSEITIVTNDIQEYEVEYQS